MFRIILIIIIFLFLKIDISSANISIPKFNIKAEYRHDTIDYDNTEKKFFREKIKVSFSKKSSLNFSHIYIETDKKNRFTGNLSLLDISPYMEFILGNYTINFGAGLLIGKKKAITPDVYSTKLIVSKEMPFSPNNSGNPFYCFNGITAGLSKPFPKLTISLNGFFSFRNRFAHNEIYESNTTKSSSNSINNRIEQEYNYTEPVEIIDYGLILALKIFENFTLQSYFFYTDIRKTGNRNILWNYSEKFVLQAVKKIFMDTAFFFNIVTTT